MNTEADDRRFIELETKLAHQEQLLSELDRALASQQAQMTRLEQLCQSLIERFRSMSEASPPHTGDERPPHY